MGFYNGAACLGSYGNPKTSAVEVRAKAKQGNPTAQTLHHTRQSRQQSHEFVTCIFVTYARNIRDVPTHATMRDHKLLGAGQTPVV